MYQVKLSKQAVKQFQKLNNPVFSHVKRKLHALENWSSATMDVKSMSGSYKGYFRMRVGNVRIIFFPDVKNKIIFVDAIGFRGDIYK